VSLDDPQPGGVGNLRYHNVRMNPGRDRGPVRLEQILAQVSVGADGVQERAGVGSRRAIADLPVAELDEPPCPVLAAG
jgi:hypothetical protein